MKNRINYIFLIGFSFLSNLFSGIDLNVDNKKEIEPLTSEFLVNKELRDNFYSDEVFYNFAMVTCELRDLMENNELHTFPRISQTDISGNLFDNFMYLFSVFEMEPFSALCQESFINKKNSNYEENVLKKIHGLSEEKASEYLKGMQDAPLGIEGYFASDLRNIFSNNTINVCRLFAIQKEVISHWISIYKLAYIEAIKSGEVVNKKVAANVIDRIIDSYCTLLEKNYEDELNKISSDFLKKFKVRDFIPYLKDLDTGIAYFTGGLILAK